MRTMEGFALELDPITVPTFANKDGYWTRYAKVEEDGIDTVRVRPVLSGYTHDDG